MKKTQCERILDYMNQFGSISPHEAIFDLGVERLASRIYDLKRKGYKIISENITSKNRFGETTHYSVYRLAEEKEK